MLKVAIPEETQNAVKTLERQTYSVDELAKVLGIGRKAASELVRQKDFPSLKFGNQYKVPIIAFEKWLLNMVKEAQ